MEVCDEERDRPPAQVVEEDEIQRAEEESLAHMSPGERALAEEDFEGRKGDRAIVDTLVGGPTDWEPDSEPPRPFRSN